MKPVEEKSPEEIIDEDLDKLEMNLRQLKVHYDQFLYGNAKQQPVLLRGQVERMVRKYANVSMRQFAHRFRFNTLLIRYQAYSELWRRRVREQEEGALPGVAAKMRVEVAEQLVARTRVADPQGNPDQLREIYKKFVEARGKSGNKKKTVSFDKFVRGIAGQAAQLRKSAGCDEIELRLVVTNDQVQLKARPG